MSGKLNFIRKGSGSKQVLFIHGNMGSRRWWLPLMEALESELDMIAVDLRGFGESPDGPSDVTLSDHARDIKDIVLDQDFCKFTIVGHSLGGAVAMQFAAEYPACLNSMVLIDSAPVDGMKNIDYPLLEVVLQDTNILIQSLKMTMAQQIDEEYFSTLAEDCLRGRAAVIPNTRALEKSNFTEAAAGFAQPVLIIHGSCDVLMPLAEAQKTAETYPNAELAVLDGCGHNPQVEAPQDCAKLLRVFLAGQEE